MLDSLVAETAAQRHTESGDLRDLLPAAPLSRGQAASIRYLITEAQGAAASATSFVAPAVRSLACDRAGGEVR